MNKPVEPDIFDDGCGDCEPQLAGKPPDWFDEEAYFRANPDVLESVTAKIFPSAYHHYVLHGRQERRPLFGDSIERRNCLVRTQPAIDKSAATSIFRASVDNVNISPNGGILIIGWVDDSLSPMECIRISSEGWYINLTANRAARIRRLDVEAALNTAAIYSFGFFSFAYVGNSLGDAPSCKVTISLSDGRSVNFDLPIRRLGELDLRNITLTYLTEAELFGNRQVESFRMLSGSLGAAIVKHNRDISTSMVRGAIVQRFGSHGKKLRGSLVICLYGKPEYLFLQNALFHGGAGFEDYEMIYVSNSPEMAEQLMKDMRTGTLLYGLTQTLVLLPGNAGFAAANNVAVTYASTDRIMIVNPDVFPRDQDWAVKHTQIITSLPQWQTKLFGAPLYYDDGSLMHGGMYFELDVGLSGNKTTMASHRMIRVEHYGKGTPAWSDEYTKSRPVPAVTGAFMSIDRTWYETLGGFTEDFVFGHYEDADLCLKSIAKGVAPWIHRVNLWHLEGKGGMRLPVHEGGSYVNRALFSERWSKVIVDGLEGRNPSHELMRPLFPDGLRRMSDHLGDVIDGKSNLGSVRFETEMTVIEDSAQKTEPQSVDER